MKSRAGKGRRAARKKKSVAAGDDALIALPREWDVLSGGRGQAFSKHAGNVRLNMFALSFQQEYNHASSKLEKTNIARKVLGLVMQPPAGASATTTCRFLSFDKTREGWFQLSEGEAHEKVGQVFRNLKKAERHGRAGHIVAACTSLYVAQVSLPNILRTTRAFTYSPASWGHQAPFLPQTTATQVNNSMANVKSSFLHQIRATARAEEEPLAVRDLDVAPPMDDNEQFPSSSSSSNDDDNDEGGDDSKSLCSVFALETSDGGTVASIDAAAELVRLVQKEWRTGPCFGL